MGIMSSVPVRKTTTSSYNQSQGNPQAAMPGVDRYGNYVGAAPQPRPKTGTYAGGGNPNKGLYPNEIPYAMPKPSTSFDGTPIWANKMNTITQGITSSYQNMMDQRKMDADFAAQNQQNQYTIDQLRANEAESRRQSGLAGAGHALDAQHYKDLYGLDMQSLGLKREGLGIDLAATGRDQGYYNTAYDQTRKAYDEAQGILTRRRTANDANWAGDQAYNTVQQGFLARLLDQSTRRSNVQLAQSGGGTGSTFNTNNISDYTLENDQGKASLAEQLRQAQEGWQNQIIGLDQTGQGLVNDLATAGLTRDSRIADSKDKAAQLGLQGKQFGVDEKTLTTNLGFNLAKSGLAASASRAPASQVPAAGANQKAQQAAAFQQKLAGMAPADRLSAIKFVTYASGDPVAIANFERMFGVPSSVVDPRVRVNAGW
jgi:hypothetical protein